MPNPPYIKGIGQLVLDRYTAQDHFEGKQFRHKASQVDLDAAPLNIDGYIANTVEEAIVDMTGILNTIGTSVYNTIQFNGNPLNKRFILNFTGLNFNVTDDPISLRTNVSIIGGSGGYATIKGDGVAATQRNIVDFINNVTVTDNGVDTTSVEIAYNTVSWISGPLTKRHILSFSGDFTVLDNGTDTTTVALAGGGGGITQLTNDVLASGSGSVSSTVVQLTGLSNIVDILATTVRFNNPGSLTYYNGSDINLIQMQHPNPSTYNTNIGDLISNSHLIGKSIDFQIGSLVSVTAADVSTDVNNLVSFNFQSGIKTHTVNVTSPTYTVDSAGNDLQLDCNLSASTVINLPPCTPGRVLIITDSGNNFDQYPVTLQPVGGNTIRSLPNAFITKKGYIGYLIGDTTGNNWALSHNEKNARFTKPFTITDLSGANLVVGHNLGELFVHVSVYDDNGYVVVPDNVQLINTNICQLDLTSFIGILSVFPNPTWNVLVSL